MRYRVPRQAVRDGIVYVTEDRKLEGFFETMSIDDNIYIGMLATGGDAFKRVEGDARTSSASDWIERLKIARDQRKREGRSSFPAATSRRW